MNIESNYEEYFIRCNLVRDPNCPVHLLEKLAYDDEWLVRYSVYYNFNCPIELKQAIACLGDLKI